MNKKNLLAVAVLALAACTSNNGGTDSPVKKDSTEVKAVDNTKSDAEAKKESSENKPAAEQKDIAMEVYNLIPKSELPKYFKDVKRDSMSLADGDYNRRLLSAGHSEGECDHHTFDLSCYPIEGENSYQVYWTHEAGCDGSLIEEAAAYVYKDGKLTSVKFDLPKPALSEFLTKEDEAKISAGTLSEIKKQFNTSHIYRFQGMTIDTFKVYVYSDYDDDVETLMDKNRPTYAWNGKKFEKINK